MDNRLQKIYEDYQNHTLRTLGLDDTFQFKCRACGKCCKNREDIILTTRDLYNIAKSLGRTTQYVIDRYCDVYIGDSSHIPLVRLQPSGPERACPLLRDRRCVVHNAKPSVCALFPLGRLSETPMDDGTEKPHFTRPAYFLQPVDCGTREETHTVRDWLEQCGMPANDEFYGLWTDTTVFLSSLFHKLETRKIPENSLHLLWDITFSALYLSYNTKTDLMSQFRDNTAKVKGFLTGIESTIDNIFGGLDDGNED